MVTIGCPPEADAVEVAVDIVLWSNDMEELNEGKLFENIGWADGEMLSKAKKRYEFGDPNDRAGVGRAVLGDEVERILWGF